jgi:uncharacterized protein YgiM (DUF1202 family)
MRSFTGRVLLLALVCVLPVKLAMAEGAVYKVVGVPQGQTLALKQSAGDSSGTVVQVPHNASWFVLRGDPKDGWQKVSWNNQQGWVKAANLEFDKAATQVKEERDFCLKDPTVTNKICCGFPPGAQSEIFKSVKVYSASGVSKGSTLQFRSKPAADAPVVISAPHNATWIVKLGQNANKDGINWYKVRWNGTTGWVDNSQISFDPEMTNMGDMKRQLCSVPAGCAPDFSGAEGSNNQ